MLDSIVSLFIKSPPETLEQLRIALLNEDSQALTQSAHGFKSVCGNLGINAMYSCCITIENLEKQGNFADIPIVLMNLESLLPQAITVLTNEFGTAKPELR